MDLSVIRNEIAKVAKKIVTVRTGTVVSNNSPLNQTLIRLDNDDSDTPVAAQALNASLAEGTRVSVLASPMFGLIVLGSLSDTLATDAQLSAIFPTGTGAWQAYTPTWSSSTPPVLGDGSISGVYAKIGRTVHYRILLTMGSTTTYGAGAYIFGLPVTAVSHTGNMSGTMRIVDASSGQQYGRHLCLNNTTTAFAIGDGASTFVQPTAPITFAAGDIIALQGTYQASV